MQSNKPKSEVIFLQLLSVRYPQLAARIDQLMTPIGMKRKPQVMLSNEAGLSPRTVGSFTRQYLVIPIARAAPLEADLSSSDLRCRRGAEAIVLHELSHFANRDIVPTFFARSLLIMTMAYASVSMLVTMLTPFLYNTLIRFYDLASLIPAGIMALIQDTNPQAAQFILHPPEIGPTQWLRYETFVFSAHWPLILGGLFLLVFFWRALLRTRELYADARIAQWQGAADIIQTELVREAARAALYGSEAMQTSTGDIQRWLMGLRRWAAARRSDINHTFSSFTLLATHPKSSVRRDCLKQPELIYGSDVAIGVTAGVTVVMLNLALGSLFLSRFLRGPNATLPFVLGFVILSLSYLPVLCAGTLTNLRRHFTRSTLIFTGIKLVPQYLVGLMLAVAVIMNPRLIDELGFTLVGGGGENVPSLGISPEFVIEVYVIRPAILFTFIMPLTLLAFLWLDTRLKRAILTWYSSPFLQKRPVALLWGITAWLAGVLWFMVLPVYNVATVPMAHLPLDPWVLILMLVMGVLSVLVVGWLMTQQRCYARRCPHCGTLICGEYQLGNRCSHCGQKLHDWLVALNAP